MTLKRPLLAATIEDISLLHYPLLATPKIDGIRCLCVNGNPVSRALKPIRNKHISATLDGLHGLDGELVLNNGTFQQTDSAIMSIEGKPDFIYQVFDFFELNLPYNQRIECLVNMQEQFKDRPIEILHPELMLNQEDLLTYESTCLSAGYEGVMLRSPVGPYKQGRSTIKEGYLMKLKRFADAEAVIIGFCELQHNGNTASANKLGLTERSSEQSGLLPGNKLGALKVRGLNGTFKDCVFNVGSGFTDEQRWRIWQQQDTYLGKTITYKYQPIGCKDLPRSPVFKGMRRDGV